MQAKDYFFAAAAIFSTFATTNKTSTMSKLKIPGVSFSLNRALGITQAKQKFARETGIPTTKAGLERKIGKMVIGTIFGKKK